MAVRIAEPTAAPTGDKVGGGVTLLLTEGNPLHEKMRDEAMPDNVAIRFAPANTRGRLARAWYERRRLPALLKVPALVHASIARVQACARAQAADQSVDRYPRVPREGVHRAMQRASVSSPGEQSQQPIRRPAVC